MSSAWGLCVWYAWSTTVRHSCYINQFLIIAYCWKTMGKALIYSGFPSDQRSIVSPSIILPIDWTAFGSLSDWLLPLIFHKLAYEVTGLFSMLCDFSTTFVNLIVSNFATSFFHNCYFDVSNLKVCNKWFNLAKTNLGQCNWPFFVFQPWILYTEVGPRLHVLAVWLWWDVTLGTAPIIFFIWVEKPVF